MPAGLNTVIVIPDKEIISVGDILLPVHGAEQEDFVISGTVVDVGKTFFYPYDPRPESADIYWRRHYNEISLSYNCPYKIKAGDRVLFHHNANYDRYGEYLLMKKDMIYAVVSEGIQAVNGWVLFEMEETVHKIDGIILPVYDKNKYGEGRVVSKAPLGEYNDYHFEAEFEGDKIYFNKRFASRLELDMHNTLTSKQSSLFKIKRRDISYALRR